MAINVERILAEGLLKLNETTELKDISVSMLLEYTGVSRQTFYNHFKDKNDLICYIYETMIVQDFSKTSPDMDFYASLLKTFENIKTHHRFMKQACMMDDQNCLNYYIFEHCKDFDLRWHQELYGEEPMPESLRFATEYHARASSSMTLSWILSDMPVPSEEIVKMIAEMRTLGMDVLMKDKNPYK